MPFLARGPFRPIILEPLLMAAGGMIIYSPIYLEKVQNLVKKYSISDRTKYR